MCQAVHAQEHRSQAIGAILGMSRDWRHSSTDSNARSSRFQALAVGASLFCLAPPPLGLVTPQPSLAATSHPTCLFVSCEQLFLHFPESPYHGRLDQTALSGRLPAHGSPPGSQIALREPEGCEAKEIRALHEPVRSPVPSVLAHAFVAWSSLRRFTLTAVLPKLGLVG